MLNHERRVDIKDLVEQIRLLTTEIAGIKNQCAPMKEFMDQVTVIKKAIMWIFALMALIGAAITWLLNVRDHLRHG